jgi:YidC/Oxa1 family membrane protein insertase
MPIAPPKTVDQGKDGKEKEPSTAEDFQKAMNTQMRYFFPIMIGYFSYSLPVGLSLYWNIFSIFSIIQHYRLKSVNGKTQIVEVK